MGKTYIHVNIKESISKAICYIGQSGVHNEICHFLITKSIILTDAGAYEIVCNMVKILITFISEIVFVGGMPGLLPNGNINLNGIDIHENASCHYERTLQVSGEKQFNLKCYCNVTARKGKEAYDIECMFTQNCYILSIFQILIGSTKIMLFYNWKEICNIIFF